METSYSKNIERNFKEGTHVKVMLTYDKGGLNGWTHRNVTRGLYVIFQPVECNGIYESFTAFTGSKYLLKELTRYSKKEWEAAMAKIQGHEEELVDLYLGGKEKQNELAAMLWN